MIKNFFVYGTLKKGGYYASYLDNLRLSSKIGVIKGFDLFGVCNRKGVSPGFPAAVKGNGSIKGEIHTFNNTKEAEMIMNSIEGYDEDSEDTSLYIQEEVMVITEDDKHVPAIMYVYNGKIKNYFPKIEEWEI